MWNFKYLGRIKTNERRFVWYGETPSQQIGDLLQEHCESKYPQYTDLLFKQRYYLNDICKQKLSSIITLYELLLSLYENNDRNLQKELTKQLPGVNQTYGDMVTCITSNLKIPPTPGLHISILAKKDIYSSPYTQVTSDHLEIYKKTKLAIDKHCVQLFPPRRRIGIAVAMPNIS